MAISTRTTSNVIIATDENTKFLLVDGMLYWYPPTKLKSISGSILNNLIDSNGNIYDLIGLIHANQDYQIKFGFGNALEFYDIKNLEYIRLKLTNAQLISNSNFNLNNINIQIPYWNGRVDKEGHIKLSNSATSIGSTNLIGLLNKELPNIYNQIMNLNYITPPFQSSPNMLLVVPRLLGVYGETNFTTTATTIFKQNQFFGIAALYLTTNNASTGETDTINIYDQNNNLIYSANITNVQNFKIPLWAFVDNEFSQGNVQIIASGVTTPTGKIVYKYIGEAMSNV